MASTRNESRIIIIDDGDIVSMSLFSFSSFWIKSSISWAREREHFRRQECELLPGIEHEDDKHKKEEKKIADERICDHTWMFVQIT